MSTYSVDFADQTIFAIPTSFTPEEGKLAKCLLSSIGEHCLTNANWMGEVDITFESALSVADVEKVFDSVIKRFCSMVRSTIQLELVNDRGVHWHIHVVEEEGVLDLDTVLVCG